MQSVWHNDVKKPPFNTLSGNYQTDVLIIGGGMAGILCVHKLKESGIDCVIAEQRTICGGVTGNTTAKITAQHGTVYHTMIKRFGTDTARQYYRAQEAALAEYARLCQSIDCDFTRCESVVYTRNDRALVRREATALRSIGCDARFETDTPLPFAIAGAVRIPRQAQFHPLKFAYSLAQELKIFENTRVLEILPDGALTPHGRIQARRVIVATHFPFVNKYGGYFLKQYQHRSYVLALKNAQAVDGMYVDTAGNGLSFRNYKDLLLLGGGGHRTGKQGSGWEPLRRFAKEHYPQATEVGYWATQDCKTLDDIPYIGRYSKHTPSVYVATGFNKWGMTSSMVAATLLADLIQGKPNKMAGIFAPDRCMLRPQLAVNALETTVNLLTPTAPRCPHLGCALHYNPYEHSWDCACHGSRFAEDGTLLDNPATHDKTMPHNTFRQA